jgi:hypothetical protein
MKLKSEQKINILTGKLSFDSLILQLKNNTK